MPAFPNLLSSLQSCNATQQLISGTTPSCIFEHFHDYANLKHSEQAVLSQTTFNQAHKTALNKTELDQVQHF